MIVATVATAFLLTSSVDARAASDSPPSARSIHAKQLLGGVDPDSIVRVIGLGRGERVIVSLADPVAGERSPMIGDRVTAEGRRGQQLVASNELRKAGITDVLPGQRGQVYFAAVSPDRRSAAMTVGFRSASGAARRALILFDVAEGNVWVARAATIHRAAIADVAFTENGVVANAFDVQDPEGPSITYFDLDGKVLGDYFARPQTDTEFFRTRLQSLGSNRFALVSLESGAVTAFETKSVAGGAPRVEVAWSRDALPREGAWGFPEDRHQLIVVGTDGSRVVVSDVPRLKRSRVLWISGDSTRPTPADAWITDRPWNTPFASEGSVFGASPLALDAGSDSQASTLERAPLWRPREPSSLSSEK